MTNRQSVATYPVAVSFLTKSRVLWVERAVLLLSLLFFCLHIFPKAWKSLNTDFPNYYLAAKLAQEHYDTSRMYEWTWIEREKDHRAIDDRVIGLLPITPFSTLAFWPLTLLQPLTAKHLWILLNLAFLIPIGWLLRKLTGLSYRTIALITFLSFPLYRNFLFGQFYILLLLLVLAAAASYVRGWQTLAGALVAIAAACKIFPLLFVVFFFRRRAWKALAATAITGGCAIAVSIAVFGLNAHRTWLHELLPWVMHGEGLGTYSTNASITGVLHCLFLAEPQWNPHPWHDSPLAYAILFPLLQMIVLAPAILLIRREDTSQRRILLEWSAFVTVALTVSTIPASYNFVLMILPVCVLAAILIQERRYGWLFALALAYLGIGFPLPAPQHPHGLMLLLYVPRLPLMIAVLFGIYALLWKPSTIARHSPNWTNWAYATAMAVYALASIRPALLQEQGERREYAYRIPSSNQAYLYASPISTQGTVRAAAFTLDGYQLIADPSDAIQNAPAKNLSYDVLSFAIKGNQILEERADVEQSQIIAPQHPALVIENDAHDPMLSHDGNDLAFLRNDHGRARLLLRPAFALRVDETPLTPTTLNVYEASFLRENEYAFSAVENGAPPRIYLTDATHHNAPILPDDSRYPALSPDGRWLAYSHLDHGFWNLWLRDQLTGTTRRIADVPCNEIQPSWEEDAKTIVYGSDCGRSVWFTAIARRKIIP